MFDIKIHGKSVRQHTHNGNLYIEGREGTEYSIGLKNNYSTRKLFVISVDGINIISGRPAEDDPHNGYVINGYDSLDLKGFRVNNNDVASFKFVKSDQSYAKGVTGSKENNGVIGVKVYGEKSIPFPQIFCNDMFQPNLPNMAPDKWDITYHPTGTGNPTLDGGCNNFYSTCLGSSLKSSASLDYNSAVNCSSVQEPSADFNLGTGWGSKQTQAVREVSFDVGALDATYILYYASRKQLEDMGIDFGPKARITMPSAFGEKKYCPVPSNWKG